MGNFDKGNRKKSGSYSEGMGNKRPSGGSPGYAKKKMLTKTDCHTCGKSCQVPFRPIAGKPVYCDNCFRNNNVNFKTNSPSPFMRSGNSDRHSYNSENKSSSPDLTQINAKLDRILKILDSE